MGYVILLFVLGTCLLVATYALARMRKERRINVEAKLAKTQNNLLENDDAVVVTEGQGKLIFINPKARDWFGLDGAELDLETLTHIVQPSGTFLELLSQEGQAAMRIGKRRVQATSHYVPRSGIPQMMVVLRETNKAEASKEGLEPMQAMAALAQITQIINNNLQLERMLDDVLEIVRTVITFEVGEITLWDEQLELLRPWGRHGDQVYFDKLETSKDAAYHLNDSISGWVKRYRQPLLIADTGLRPDVKPKIESYGLRSILATPLMVADRFIGTIEVASKTRVAFDHEDLEFLQMVAGQISIATENKRLSNIQTERIAELRGLQQIASASISLYDEGEQAQEQGVMVFGDLCAQIANLMDVESCGILLYDEQEQALISAPPFFGIEQDIILKYRIDLSFNSPVRDIFNSGEYWYSNDVLNDNTVHQLGLHGLAELAKIVNTAMVPLAIGTRRFGALQVSNRRDYSGFTEEDMRLLNAFASQVAVVVENTRLANQERRRVLEVRGLQDVSKTLTELGDSDKLFAQITSLIAGLLDARICGLLTYDAVENKLVARRPIFGLRDDLLSSYEVPFIKDGELYRHFVQGLAILSNDVANDPLLMDGGFDQGIRLMGITQMVFVPLRVGGQRVGAIHVANHRRQQPFTEDHVTLLQIYAAQIAIILENMRLFQEANNRTEEAERLRNIAEVTSSNRELNDIISRVIGETVRLLDADLGTLGLLDESAGQISIRPEWSYGAEGLNTFNIDIYTQGFSNSVLMTKRTFTTTNIHTDVRILPLYKQIANRYAVNAAIQTALIVDDRGVGELTIGRRDARQFSPREINLVESITAQLAISVSRQRTFKITDESLRTRVTELDALTRISAELNRTTQLDRILETIRKEGQRTNKADGATVIVLKNIDEWRDLNSPMIDERFGELQTMPLLAPIEQEVARRSTLIYIADYDTSEWAPIPATARSALAIPVFYGDASLEEFEPNSGLTAVRDVVGVVHFFSEQADAFPQDTHDFAKTLANQAAIAIANQIREREQKTRAQELRSRTDQIGRIFEIGNMLSSGQSLAEVLEAVAYGISEAVGFGVVTVNVVDANSQTAKLDAQAGLPLDVTSDLTRQPATVKQIQNLLLPNYGISKSFFIPAEAIESQYAPPLVRLISESLGNTFESRRTKASGTWTPGDLLIIPTRTKDNELTGFMVVDNPGNGLRPTEPVVEAIETFAQQAGIAIENDRVLRRYQGQTEVAEEQRDLLQQLYVYAAEFSRATDVSTRLKAVAEGIRAVGWGRAMVSLRDSNFDPTELVCSGYTEEQEAQLRGVMLSGEVWQERFEDREFRRYRLGGGYYLRQSDPYITENKLMSGLMEMPEAPESLNGQWQPYDTFYLPMYGSDRSRPIGLISMDTPANNKVPTESEMRSIELFAQQAAGAIENTSLVKEVQDRATQEQRINELTEAISATLERDPIIQSAASGLIEMIPFTNMTVGLLEVGNAGALTVLKVNISPRGIVQVQELPKQAMDNTVLGATVMNISPRIYYSSDWEALPSDAPERNLVDLAEWFSKGERTILLVPILAGGRAVGALHMGSTFAQAVGFTEQLPLVSRIANLMGVALENASLLQRTRELQSFTGSVLESIQQGIVVMDNEMKIRTINSFMRTTYDWEDDAVDTYLFDYRPSYRVILEETIQRVVLTNQPAAEYNVEQIVPNKDAPVVRNFYVYPLRSGQTVTGLVLLVEDQTARAALESGLANRERQLATLTDISGQLTTVLDPDTLVQLMFDQMGRILEYDTATLWLRDDKNLVIRATKGFDNPEDLIGVAAEIEESDLFKELAARGQVLNIADMTKDPRFPVPEDHPMRSWLGVSLVSRNTLSGLLTIEKTEANFYSAEVEQLARAFANQVAVALENANLYTQASNDARQLAVLYQESAQRAEVLDQQSKRLDLLYNVAGRLSQSLELESIFETVMTELLGITGSERAMGYTIEEDRAREVAHLPRTDSPPDRAGSFPLRDAKLINDLRQLQEPIIISDAINDPRMAGYFQQKERSLSLALVPLIAGGELLGFISLHFDNVVLTDLTDQMETLKAISAQAAIALQNSRLYAQSVERAIELETISNATREITSSLDMQAAVRNVANQMVIALEAEGCDVLNWLRAEDVLQVAIDVGATSIDPIGSKMPLPDYPLRQRALATGQTVVMWNTDPNLTVKERELLERHKANSRLLLPMIVRKEVIGLLELDFLTPMYALSASKSRAATSLSSQAAVILENAGLQSEALNKLNESFVISQISEALAANTEVSDLFEIIKQRLPALVQSDILIGAWVNPQGLLEYPVALFKGEQDDLPVESPGDDEIAFVLGQMTPIRFVSVEVEAAFKAQRIKARYGQPRSLIGVPLIAGDEVHGALYAADLSGTKPLGFDAQRVLTTVGSQLAVALQTAQLFKRSQQFAEEMEKAVTQRTKELQQERDNLNFVFEFANMLNTSMEDPMTQKRALEMLHETVEADFSLLLKFDDLGKLSYQTSVNITQEEATRPNLISTEGLATRLIELNSPIIIQDLRLDERWMLTANWPAEPRSVIAAPLIFNQDAVGMLLLFGSQPRQFGDEQMRLVSVCASPLANALNNSSMFSYVREQSMQLGDAMRQQSIVSSRNVAIVQSIADGIIVADREGLIIEFNAASERILGLRREQMLGKHISELAGIYGNVTRQGWVDLVRQWTEAADDIIPGSEYRDEITLDNTKVISIILSPVAMGGVLLGTVTVLRDISRETEVERMKAEFVATVSHELRTPMTSIKGYADLLMLGAAGQITDQQNRFLTTIKTNADRLSVLVNELLDISRIDRKSVALNLQPVDLEDVVDISLQQIEDRMANERKELEVSTDIPTDLPLLRADFDKVTQVLNHLLNNAFSYTNPGGQITVSAYQENDKVIIAVQDTGVGISPEKRNRIWDRFYRDEEQRLVMETSGAGLGLPIVKEYVGMHNGDVWLESEVGKGSTFYVRLPAYIEEN
jgi:PAS domain S-box-containing protein